MADQYQEGAIADGPNGAYLVYRGGNWYPSQQDGRPVERIPRPDYGSNHYQLPNGDIVRQGPRGGQETVEAFGGAGGGSGGGSLVGADARGRYQIGADSLVAAARGAAEEEAKGGNPLNRDWGAVALNSIDLDPRGDSSFRPFAPLARIVGGQDFQNYDQALATYEASLLPIQSGASVTESEARRQIRADFPQVGDSEETVQRKASNRLRRINAVFQGIGRELPFSEEQIANPTAIRPEDEASAINALQGAGPTDPETGLPSYTGVTRTNAGDLPLPEGGYTPDPNAPQPGDVRVTSQPLAPTDTPNSLSAQGYVYDAGTDTWRRSRTEEATAADRGWTPESAVAQRDRMNPILRTVDAFGRGAADAVSLEFADEIAAGGDALFGQGEGSTVGERYRNNLEVQRAIDAADGEDYGLARNAGEVAGFGIAAIGAAPRVLAAGARRFASPLLNGAVTGVRNALGGAAVAGTAAAGAETGNLLERAQAALKAAPVGAFVGAVAPPVVNALSRPVVNAGQSAARFVGRQVGRAGEAVGVRGATALRERATPSALNVAVERFGQRMGPARVAQTADNVQRARDLGVDANLITGLDDGSIGRVRALATRDTPAREAAVVNAVATRDRLPSRVREIADQEVSSDARPTIDVIDDLAANRRENAAAIQTFGSDPVDLSDNVVAALQGNTSRGALRAAADRAGSSLDESERLAEPMLRALAESGPASARLSVREVQDISAALRKAADSAYRTGSPEGPILSQLGNAIRQAGRDQSEGYGAWLGQYADDSSLLEAATLGRNFVSVSDDPISGRSTDSFVRAAENMTAPERAVQRSASRSAMEAAASSPGKARSTLDAVASDVDFYRRADAMGVDADRLAARARGEIDNLTRQQRASPRVGSETNTNQQDTLGAATDAIGDIATVARRPISGALDVAVRRFQARGFSDAEAEALVNAAIDPAMTNQLIALLSQRMSRREARSLARAVQRSLASGQGSSIAAQ